MFWKNKRKPTKIDTSIDGYKYIGIKLTEEQLFNLSHINTLMQKSPEEIPPVHCILLVLKELGLIPTEFEDEKGNYESDCNLNKDFQKWYQRIFGRFKES